MRDDGITDFTAATTYVGTVRVDGGGSMDVSDIEPGLEQAEGLSELTHLSWLFAS